MKSKFLKKIIACSLIGVSLIAIKPIKANAEWRQNNNKWYYYNNGQMLKNTWFYDINSKKNYYLQTDGSMATNTTINGYYVENDGALTSNSMTINDIKTKSDLNKYLDENYSSLDTPIGKLKFTFYIHENDDSMTEHDFWIETKYGKIENSKYDLYTFSPYDLEHNIKISNSDKEKTIDLLKEYQKDVAKVAMKAFQDKKIKGGFHDSWYRYPNIRVDLITVNFFSWKNYNEIDEDYRGFDDYYNTEVGDFQWDDEYDDYFNG